MDAKTLGLLCLIFAVCGFSKTVAKLHIQDLSYAFDNTTWYWPSMMNERFRFISKTKVGSGPTFYSANTFCAAEHGGTHLDAPIHFAEGKHTVGQIPLTQLIANVAVIDAQQKASSNRDLQIGEADFLAYEKKHGRIADQSIILLNSGWGKYWPNATLFFGTATNNTSILHFPGLHPDGATWLIQKRKIKAIGIDTASIDYGQSKTYQAHRNLMTNNVPVFENVANLDKVPSKGAMVYALPMKIAEGTGAPLRIIATWDDSKIPSSASGRDSSLVVLFVCILGVIAAL